MLREERAEEHTGPGLDDDECLKNAGLPLLDFLVPRRIGGQVSSVPLHALLSGPPHCGKTSLLLQLAYNLAIDTLAKVVFICKPENFEDDYIFLSRDLDISCKASDRIHIKYINNDEELSKYFAAFHMHAELPTAVIVDDFVEFFGGWAEHKEGSHTRTVSELPLVKTLCLCHSAVNYANAKAGSGLQCRLVISDTHPADGPRLLYIFKRWLSQVFVIKALDDPSAFTLQLQDETNDIKMTVVGRYTLAQQVLYFDGLERQLEPIE